MKTTLLPFVLACRFAVVGLCAPPGQSDIWRRAIGDSCKAPEGSGSCLKTSSCKGISYPTGLCPKDPKDVQVRSLMVASVYTFAKRANLVLCRDRLHSRQRRDRILPQCQEQRLRRWHVRVTQMPGSGRYQVLLQDEFSISTCAAETTSLASLPDDAKLHVRADRRDQHAGAFGVRAIHAIHSFWTA